MTGFLFNIDGGYLEGLCRGFKCGILKQSDYLNLVQCETLEGKNSLYFAIIGPAKLVKKCSLSKIDVELCEWRSDWRIFDETRDETKQKYWSYDQQIS